MSRVDEILELYEGDEALISALTDHGRELEAIVAKLPKAADGVPVVPGMPLYEPRTKPCGCTDAKERTGGHTIEADGHVRRFGHMGSWLVKAADCYSTRKAAEAASKPVDA